LAVTIALAATASQALGNIYQWAYVNPNDPSLGVVQSTTLYPSGSGASAVPNANLRYLNLAQAYLINANLSNAILSYGTLTNANLTAANLTGARLDHATLDSANLTGATVTSADFSSTDLTASQIYTTANYQTRNMQGIVLSQDNLPSWNLSGQNLANANLTYAYLASGTLTNANLTQANLSWGTLTGANFSGARIAGANFGFTNLAASQFYSTVDYKSGNLQGIDLEGDNLSRWDFSGQYLNNIVLWSANLTNANFAGATVAGARFDSTNLTASQLYSTTSYKAKYLEWIGLEGNNLSGWNFSGQDLSNAQLAGATLTSANMAGATVAGADFSSANLATSQLYSTASYQTRNLQGIALVRSNLTGWNFANQNLTNANLSFAIMSSANLSGANLTGANLSSGSLANADLTDANLTNANLASANLSTSLSGAIVTGANLVDTRLSASQLYSTGSYQGHDLQGIQLGTKQDEPLNLSLQGWNFSGQNLTSANFAQCSLYGTNFAAANLTNADFWGAELTNANLTGAIIAGANSIGLTASQLFSTASYKARDLQGIVLYCGLTGGDLSGQNLANANLSGCTLKNADLTGAIIAGANCMGLTASQLLSTASYRAHDLQGIVLNCDLTGGNLSGQNLANANLTGCTLTNANLQDANLTNTTFFSYPTNLTGADLRGATGFSGGRFSYYNTNVIFPDGTIQGLTLDSTHPTFLVRNYSRNIPIEVQQGMTISPGSSLVIELDGNPWGSTISSYGGLVTLGGTLKLDLAAGATLASLAGGSIPLFNWAGVNPSGSFSSTMSDLPAGYSWNTSQLYSTGNVTLVCPAWNKQGPGSWNTPSNWTVYNVPDGVGQVAVLGPSSSALTTVTLDGAQTIGALKFGGRTNYTLAAGNSGSLTLDDSGGAIGGQIIVLGGTHSITAPLVIANSGAIVTLSGSGGLGISGGIGESGGSQSLTLAGDGTGLLVLSGSNSYTGGTFVAAGTLAVTASKALPRGTSLTVSPGGTFVFDPSRTFLSPAADTAVAVPKPSTLALLGAGAMVLLIRRVGRRAPMRSIGRRVPPGKMPKVGGTRFTRRTLHGRSTRPGYFEAMQ